MVKNYPILDVFSFSKLGHFFIILIYQRWSWSRVQDSIDKIYILGYIIFFILFFNNNKKFNNNYLLKIILPARRKVVDFYWGPCYCCFCFVKCMKHSSIFCFVSYFRFHDCIFRIATRKKNLLVSSKIASLN